MKSIRDFLKERFEDVSVVLQNVPETPTKKQFVIQFQNNASERETSFTVRTQREFRVIYFDEQAPNVFERMDKLNRLFLYGRLIIPITDSLRYIRVATFSFGEIFKTEQDENIEACIGVLTTEIREARDYKQYEKIMEVYSRFN